MKKKYLFVALLLPLIFSGCDGNFGVQEICGTYLIFRNISELEIKLNYKSEKLGIPSLRECKDMTDDEDTLIWLKNNNLVKENENFKVFRIPVGNVHDSKNVDIYFEAETDSELYTATLNIKMLNNAGNHGYVNKEFPTLKSQRGNSLTALFTYCFWRSI